MVNVSILVSWSFIITFMSTCWESNEFSHETDIYQSTIWSSYIALKLYSQGGLSMITHLESTSSGLPLHLSRVKTTKNSQIRFILFKIMFILSVNKLSLSNCLYQSPKNKAVQSLKNSTQIIFYSTIIYYADKDPISCPLKTM